MHFRRVRRDVEALVAGLAENIPAHTDARFVVETMGTAIRALLGIERDHNAHMVRVILRDIFGLSGNITRGTSPAARRIAQNCNARRRCQQPVPRGSLCSFHLFHSPERPHIGTHAPIPSNVDIIRHGRDA